MAHDQIAREWEASVEPYGRRLAETRMAPCEQLVSEHTGIDHLAYFRLGNEMFAIDAWQRAQPRPDGTSPAVADVRRAERRLNQQLAKLDEYLTQMNTGQLTRMVVHGKGGALLSHVLIPDHALIAAVTFPDSPVQPRQPEVCDVDEAMAVLIARLRQEIDLQPQDGEGFPSPAEADPFAWSENEDLVHALPRLLDGTPALNYVALVEHGVRIFSEAEFGQAMQIPMVANDPDLDPAQVQAHRYDTFCGLLPGLVRTLSRLVSPVIGQGAERIVLNVERGAAFIYTLPGDRYLLAVTLDQSQVGVVDDRIGQFVLAAAERLSLS